VFVCTEIVDTPHLSTGVSQGVKSLDIGAARLTIINLGDLNFTLRDVISIQETEWRSRYGSLFEQRLAFPSQSIHVALEESSVLVDAGDYLKFAKEGAEYVDPTYRPPAGLIEQLLEIGVGPEDVTHVVLTHAHYDHYAGVTTNTGGSVVPAFPRAHHFLGRGDWEWEVVRNAMADPSSNEAQTLEVINRLGILKLVLGDEELVPGVKILSAPGESPGHQILVVRSEGQAAYCVGDLFHHSIEVEHPEWMAPWCDAPLNLRSRMMILESAVQEDAILIPAHMIPGRIKKDGRFYSYVPLS
jgi:glyoxylase-like metal-dependent hydrolase (beta-lactamase superfamily II)